MTGTKEISKDGTIRYGYYDSDNYFIFHRDEKDGPAIIDSDGTQEWWINDKRHREYGPAFIYSDGTQLWWYNFRLITKEVEQWLEERNIGSNPDNMTEEDKLALSFYMRSLT